MTTEYSLITESHTYYNDNNILLARKFPKFSQYVSIDTQKYTYRENLYSHVCGYC